MPRFAITKYTPTKDASPWLASMDPERVVLELISRPDARPMEPQFGCPCGCGEIPAGRRAIFKMGHDARLRGKLIRAHLTGTEIRYVLDGELQEPQTATQVANLYQWAPYLEDAQLRRAGEVRPLADRALGSRRRIKVGRWEYIGTVIAVHHGEYVIEYETLTGIANTIQLPPDNAPLAQEKKS